MDELIKWLEFRILELKEDLAKVDNFSEFYIPFINKMHARISEAQLILDKVREAALTELTRIVQENDMGY